MIHATIASERRHGLSGPQRGGMPDMLSPPMVELRKAALPALAIGDDPRAWPRLSFRLPPGGRLVIRADRDTGAGVLRLIARQDAAAAGAVCLDGRDIWLLAAPEIRDQVALVDAVEARDPEASLWQVMARALLPQGCDWGEVRDPAQREAIGEALGRMGLLGKAATLCGALDAGGRLALAIARALLLRPQILLIDATSAAASAPVLQMLAESAAASDLTVVTAISGGSVFPDWASERLDLRDGRF